MRFTITQLTKHLISDYNCQYSRWSPSSRLQIEQLLRVKYSVKFYQFRFSQTPLIPHPVFNDPSVNFLKQICHFLLQYRPSIQFDFINRILGGVNNNNLCSIFLIISYLQLRFPITNFSSEKSIRLFFTIFNTKFTSATRILPFPDGSALSGYSIASIFCWQWTAA